MDPTDVNLCAEQRESQYETNKNVSQAGWVCQGIECDKADKLTGLRQKSEPNQRPSLRWTYIAKL